MEWEVIRVVAEVIGAVAVVFTLLFGTYPVDSTLPRFFDGR